MCGICGVVVPAGASDSIDRQAVLRMRDVLTHRGPDDAGVFLSDRAALGHRRLSIVDLSGGHQPLSSDDGSLHLVYNGEVFNHSALRVDLEARGHRYVTHCDTETVLRTFQEERQKAPTKLRGMFAFAIWDERRGELFLARDRLGIKPLYYARRADGGLVFASEIKGILAYGGIRPSLNLSALPDYLANHAPSGEETMFAGIRRLLPGHTLTWRDGQVKIEQYWDVTFEPEASGRSDADYVEEYSERFREAVRTRLMADVPLGVFLSGGIDSAALTAVMSELAEEPIQTFSVAFAEREANEFEYARVVAEKFRTNHREVIVAPDEFFSALPRLVWHEDEPIAHPSSIALNFVSRLAAKHVKVVLTGEGSDETLAGYNKYRTTIYNLKLGQAYERVTPQTVRRVVRRGVQSLAGLSLARKADRTFLTRSASLDAMYLDNFAVFGKTSQSSVLSADVKDTLAMIDPYASWRHAFESGQARTLLGRLLYADTKTYLHELLMKQDQMSMAASIESRVPFLDHHLIEFAARLPDRMKLRGLTTKYILRQAMTGVLPPVILSRKKMGFPVPIGAWLRGPYTSMLDDFVLGDRAITRGLFDASSLRSMVDQHRRGTANHGQRLWALINLELWHRIFIDGEESLALAA